MSVSLLSGVEKYDPAEITLRLKKYFSETHPLGFAIQGALVLNPAREVIGAYSPLAGSSSLLGTTYSGIDFPDSSETTCSLLNIYRTDKGNPSGVQCPELACKVMNPDGNLRSWLIFQLDMDYLQNEFGINQKTLKEIISK